MYGRQWVITPYVCMRTLIWHHFTWLHITWFNRNTQAHCLFTMTPTLVLQEKTCQFNSSKTDLTVSCFLFLFLHSFSFVIGGIIMTSCSHANIPHTHVWAYQHCLTPQYVCSFIYISGIINEDVNSSLLQLGYVSAMSFHDDHVPCLLTSFCGCCYIHTVFFSVSSMDYHRRLMFIAYASVHACRPSINNACIQW